MTSTKAIKSAFSMQNVSVAAAAECKFIIGSATVISFEYVGNPFMHETWHCQKRFMRSKRVRDRSIKKKETVFEKIMEKQNQVLKVLTVMEILKHEPEQVMTMKSLAWYKRQLNITSDDRIPLFLKKYPKLFELYTGRCGVTWCGLTAEAGKLLQEEMRLKEEYESTAVNYIRRFLMMSVEKTLQVDKIAHFKREFGLPEDFQKEWIYRFPEFFRVVKKDDDVLYLKLTSWDPTLAVTELERKAKKGRDQNVVCSEGNSTPGLLTVPFPFRWPSRYPRRNIPDRATKNFQELPYLSPYADPSNLIPGTKEFEKRAVAVLHEMLSFTLEKRLIIDCLTHFRWEFRLPQKLMRLLLRYFGIFYVSEKGKRFHVFLATAYEGSELIEKSSLALCKEKVEELMGENWKRWRRKITYAGDDKALDGVEILGGGEGLCSRGYYSVQEEDGDIVASDVEDKIEKELIIKDDEMDVAEVIRAYES